MKHKAYPFLKEDCDKPPPPSPLNTPTVGAASLLPDYNRAIEYISLTKTYL